MVLNRLIGYIKNIFVAGDNVNALNETKILFVEGNISGGKSTLLENIDKYIKEENITDRAIIGFEPLAKWLEEYKTEDGTNLLALFYGDQRRWAFTFQMTVLMNRFKMIQELVTNNRGKIIIIERSIFTDYRCFALNLHLRDKIPLPEWKIYEEWFLYWKTLESNLFEGCDVKFVYLRTPPDVCFDRIQQRGRVEENGVPLEYLQDIHERHENWLNSNGMHDLNNSSCLEGEVIIMDGQTRPEILCNNFLFMAGLMQPH